MTTMGVSMQIGFTCDGPDDGERPEACEIITEPILTSSVPRAWAEVARTYGWHKRAVGGFPSYRHSGYRHYCPACWAADRERKGE